MNILRLVAVVGLTTLLLPTAAASTASTPKQRPFKASCTAIPDDPLSPQVRVTGTCRSTHLGRETFTASHELVATAPPDANGILPVAIVGGRGTHVAANGDELHSVYSGTGLVNLVTGRIDFELAGQFVGGTGRFANAAGSTRSVGVVENGVATYVENGWISY